MAGGGVPAGMFMTDGVPVDLALYASDPKLVPLPASRAGTGPVRIWMTWVRFDGLSLGTRLSARQ